MLISYTPIKHMKGHDKGSAHECGSTSTNKKGVCVGYDLKIHYVTRGCH